MIVWRIFQILNEQFNNVESDGVGNKRGSSRMDLAILTAFVSESLRKLNPKSRDMLELTRKKMNFFGSLEQAINNGVSVRPVVDPFGQKERAGISTSKIVHQLDYSISLINEIIRRQRR
uniref:Uncharacterized protein n=1 Tax=Romanomermis culicivorax TaxID=13658 RepID=A0A915JUG6_ROMCU